jgi:predicted O-methyltransferase YrrM
MPDFQEDTPLNQMNLKLFPRQKEVIAELCLQVAKPGMIAVEIGSWTGQSTSVIAPIVRTFGGVLYCVDWFKGTPTTHLADVANQVDIYAKFKQNMREIDVEDILKVMVMSSDSAARIFQDHLVDFLFIDADHRYPAVKQDLDLWCPKMRPTGIICGHDCEVKYDSLTDAQKSIVCASLDQDYTRLEAIPGIEGIHAGVVKAVYDRFGPDYEIDQTIWWRK